MDLASLIGFVGAVALFSWALFTGSNGNIGGFWDTPSITIVLGGGVLTTLLSVRLNRFLGFAGIVKNAFFAKSVAPDQMIRQFVKLAEVARREGMLALQGQVSQIPDKFVANALQMVIDGTDPESVKQAMEFEIACLDARHSEGKQVLDLMGKYAPAYGMIGTLVGLVVMLQNMNDPKAIGPGMAVALLTTLYGAIMANMICLPLADKLNNTHTQEMMAMTLAQAAVMAIQAGDNPRALQAKLAVFLAPSARKKLLAESEK
ncbi:MAG: MotA/TolQ/ExbB proton channel family protein [Planctomycetia bacterium]|nr:MAG: MotA/TolQ/ExbB proton channel family protein [Planctomycetia bacterium]